MTTLRSILTWRKPGEAWREVGSTDRTIINHDTDREGRRKAHRMVPMGCEWRLEVFGSNRFHGATPMRVIYGRRVNRTTKGRDDEIRSEA